MSKPKKARLVLCLRRGDAEDLEAGKVYEELPDPKAVRDGYLRIIDESGDDYLYPADWFIALQLPPALARELAENLEIARRAATTGAR